MYVCQCLCVQQSKLCLKFKEICMGSMYVCKCLFLCLSLFVCMSVCRLFFLSLVQSDFNLFGSVEFGSMMDVYVCICVLMSVCMYVQISGEVLQTSTEDWQLRSANPSQRPVTSFGSTTSSHVYVSFVY